LSLTVTFAAIVYSPFAVFVRQPLLALIPAAVFAVLYRVSSRPAVGAAAVLWLLYALYEYGIHRRWLCSGECNIRVDLLLLCPVLWLVSLAAGIAGFNALRRRPESRPGV
jgi:hypothetical protein